MDCTAYNVSNNTGSDILYINFNQDYSCISVGTKTGFRIYNCDPFSKFYQNNQGGAAICEMMFCSSLVATAGSGESTTTSPRKVHIINTKRETVICELNFMSKVLNLHINRKRLAVVLEDRIHIYDVTTMKLLHTIDTLPNSTGISAMSSDSEKSVLAYPSNSNTGELTIFDCINLRPLSIIKAHKTAVTKMTFNEKGDFLATASDKGTIIRVFKIPTAEKLYQFRRGSLPANIHHLAFNSESNLLSVTSDSDTIHIFKLTIQSASFFGSLLPEKMSEAWESTRDFGHIKHPKAGSPALCAFTHDSNQIIVVSADGSAYFYTLNQSDGSCQFLSQNSLLDSSESLNRSISSEVFQKDKICDK